MDFKEYLMSLDWNAFSSYPEQGSSIYLHCYAIDDSTNKFLKIDNFNAVFFDTDQIVNGFPNHKWRFTWLSANEIDKNYAESNFVKCSADDCSNQARR